MAYNANVHPGIVERTTVPPRSKHTADLDTSVAAPVTHERIQPTLQQDVLYEVHRDIHHYDLQTTIQPVIQQEFLPAKHWLQTPRGLVSIGPGTTVQALYEMGLRNGIQTAEGERVAGGAERKKALLEEIRMIEMAKVAQEYQSTKGVSGGRQQQQNIPGQQSVPGVHHDHHLGHHEHSTGRGLMGDDNKSASRNAMDTHHQHSSAGRLTASERTKHSPQGLDTHHRHQHHGNPNYYDKHAEESKLTTQDDSRSSGPPENDLSNLGIDRRAPLPPFEHASDRHELDHDGGGSGHRNKLKKTNPPAHKIGVTKE